jgi:hypothetical protein
MRSGRRGGAGGVSAGLLVTPRTVRCVRQPLECFGFGRTLALGLDGRSWRGGRGRAWSGPGAVSQDAEPKEDKESQLRENMMQHQGIAPSKRGEMGTLYRVFWVNGIIRTIAVHDLRIWHARQEALTTEAEATQPWRHIPSMWKQSPPAVTPGE